MEWSVVRPRLAGAILLGAASIGAASGCRQQKGTATGKTYTSDQKGGQGGGLSASGGSQSGGRRDARPLDSPADTTNGKSSAASDSGTSDATRGQVVAEPGAPVEHDPQKKLRSVPSPPRGHP
jgi:hypothetical protein